MGACVVTHTLLSRVQTKWQVCNPSAMAVERLPIIMTNDCVMKQSGKTEILQQKTYVKVGLVALTRPNCTGSTSQIIPTARKQKD